MRNLTTFRNSLAAVILIATVGGCNSKVMKNFEAAPGPSQNGPGREEKGETNLSFLELKTKILDVACNRCHDAGSEIGDFTTYATTLSVVVPGQSARSLLFTEVQSNDMPRRRGPLTDDEKTLIRTWIDSGAPEFAREPQAPPTFNDVKAKIFDQKCIMCHSDAQRVANFSLENYDVVVADARLVVAGNAAKSGLYASVTDDYMPPKRSVSSGIVQALTSDEKIMIKNWIEAGAQK